MTDSTDPNDFLMGGVGVPSARFPAVGTTVTGTITERPQVRQQTDLATGELLTWQDGRPRNQLVITLATDSRDDSIEDDDGARRVYAKGNMLKAIADAVRKAGAAGLEAGGWLTVTYTGNGEQKQRGFNPPKLYTATYRPPDAATAVLREASAERPSDASPAFAPTPDPKLAAALAALPPEVRAALAAQQQQQ